MSSSISFGNANAGFQAGIITGNVDAMFHQAPGELRNCPMAKRGASKQALTTAPTLERLQTPPPPDIVIPFARDLDFVDGGTTLGQVDQICAAPDSESKSQIAIEYAYRIWVRSPETWVLWVHARNAARFEQSFHDIADRVKIAKRDPPATIFKLVHDWLCDCKQRWLLVLDNVDDASFLLDAPTTSSKTAAKPLREYLPHCERGSVLITTWNKGIALKLVEQRDIISVEPMAEMPAVALFEKKLGGQGSRGESDDVAQLAAALEYMPLAIVQAAAYISLRTPRCSVAQYLDEFWRSNGTKTSLLNYDDGQLRRDWEAKNSIIIMWQISFEHLQRNRPSAADLLSLMSFFDRQGIPEALIRGTHGMKQAGTTLEGTKTSTWNFFLAFLSPPSHPNEAQDGCGKEFENSVEALRNLCFISVDTDGATFEMHSLVQLATRRWLTANGKLERWKQQFTSNLCAAFPTGKYKNWSACQALFAHAKAASEQRPYNDSLTADWATVLYRAAWYAESTGNIADAVMLATKAMKARKKMLGQKHEDTIQSIAMVADAYSLGGQWDEAEKLRKQVMETCKKKLGADHPSTLTSMANLASTYWNQGRWDAAEELFVQVMETCKKKLGADHPDTLTSMANLASTYRNQGRWDAAEELFVQVMETCKKKLGADHPDTLTSMANLAFTWKAQGWSAEAIALMRQCIQQRQQVLKAGHPDLASSLSVLEQWRAEPILYARVPRNCKLACLELFQHGSHSHGVASAYLGPLVAKEDKGEEFLASLRY
ncbi:hypothetical protein CC86DRAFT_387312 [Ophiobolus disseminans]|uniref:Uncharacterized protein n=1 Tax=Ophiobolus disseminans TaxID=1469910 RepID=A0A6A6ZGM9_9PLEO|nr:hypothetical protein CC86DRAFT_387312 [Ophiobolus disseminans]